MSMARLLIATRDQLWSAISVLDETNCGINPDGQPPPFAGQLYVSVHGTEWTVGGMVDGGLDEEFGIACTVTMRAGFTPDDRMGDSLYIKLATGLEDLVRKIIVEIRTSRWIILNAANALMPDDLDGFVEPLRWLGVNAEPRIVGPEWFHAAPDVNNPTSGLSMEVRLDKARRIQALANLV
tara:strand:+ start:248 stop:790 length:543 start_codon:yes stop_codon:yes gene_type:complete